jgi:hypothetical protein
MTESTTDVVKPRRVLIAEDEALIRLDLAEMLRGRRPSSWPRSSCPTW